jgi:hypothetical protein
MVIIISPQKISGNTLEYSVGEFRQKITNGYDYM